MCNIAAYIGNKRAAPILIEMLRKQQGYDAGFYTGIATIDHNGKIHMRKSIGDLDHLLRTTDAESLPGNTGFIHGRTPGFGDSSWAHPFWSPDKNFVMILNGNDGFFSDTKLYSKKCQELEEQGYVFRTALEDVNPGGIRNSRQLRIHPSELRTYIVDRQIAQNQDVLDGLKKGVESYPGEIVTLLLNQGEPDHIYISRINMPMIIGRNSNELYAASAPFGLPDDRTIDSIMSIQPKTINKISIKHVHTIYLDISTPVINHLPWHTAENKIKDILKHHGPISMAAIRDQLNPIWPEGVLPQKNQLLYHLLPDMCQRGIIKMQEVRIPGQEEPHLAPSILFSLQSS